MWLTASRGGPFNCSSRCTDGKGCSFFVILRRKLGISHNLWHLQRLASPFRARGDREQRRTEFGNGWYQRAATLFLVVVLSNRGLLVHLVDLSDILIKIVSVAQKHAKICLYSVLIIFSTGSDENS